MNSTEDDEGGKEAGDHGDGQRKVEVTERKKKMEMEMEMEMEDPGTDHKTM